MKILINRGNIQNAKSYPYWDDLFVNEADLDDPVEVLEARSALYYWSRFNGEVSLSDIFVGKETLDIKDNFFRDSLRFEVNQPPLESVVIEVIAEWNQRASGECEIGHLVEERFNKGLVNSLTGLDLASRWWKTGEKVGHIRR